MARRLPDGPGIAAPGRAVLAASAGQHLCRNDRQSELDLVLRAWVTDGAHSEQTLLRMSETVRRFSARLDALGVGCFCAVTPNVAAEFCTAPTRTGTPAELPTQHGRRTALRMLFRSLRAAGFPVGDPTVDLMLPPRSSTAARPLTDDEVTLCRATSQWGMAAGRRALIWALGEATAVSSEITAVRVQHLDDPRTPTQVWLTGTTRHDPRWGRLSEWGRQVLARHLQQRREGVDGVVLDPQLLLAYGGAATPGGATAQVRSCQALREVLDRAGLAQEADVRPSSLRHWAGRRLLDRGSPIEQVALALGHRSLDACAEDIGLTWRVLAVEPPAPAMRSGAEGASAAATDCPDATGAAGQHAGTDGVDHGSTSARRRGR